MWVIPQLQFLRVFPSNQWPQVGSGYARLLMQLQVQWPLENFKRKQLSESNFPNPFLYMAFENCQIFVYNLHICCNIPQGPQQVGSPLVLPFAPYNLFPSGLGFSATTKSSPKVRDGGKSLCDLWAVHAGSCTCILNMYKGEVDEALYYGISQ